MKNCNRARCPINGEFNMCGEECENPPLKRSLSEIICELEFDYEIVKKRNGKYLRLIDMQHANLGNIESELFLINKKTLALQLIDRLDNYINDYGLNNDVQEPENILVDDIIKKAKE